MKFTTSVMLSSTVAASSDENSLLQSKLANRLGIDTVDWVAKLVDSPESTISDFMRLNVGDQTALLQLINGDAHLALKIEKLPDGSKQHLALAMRQAISDSKFPASLLEEHGQSIESALSKKEMEEGDSCTPTSATNSPCAVAMCIVEPGCTLVPGDYFWTSDDACCQEQCKMNCDGDSADYVVGEPCTQTGDACPVARCAQPAPGCDWREGDWLWTSDGRCCQELCPTTCDEGQPCTQTVDNNVFCPVALLEAKRCAQPEPGCMLVEGDWLWTGDGRCCQEQCKVSCDADLAADTADAAAPLQ